MNYVNIVIKPLDNATNAITVQAKPGEFIVIVILEWTKLVWTPAPGTLFVTHSGCPRHVERNYVPLFGVDTIERRLT